MRVELALKNGKTIYGQKALGFVLLLEGLRFGAVYFGDSEDTLKMPVYSCGQRIGYLIFDGDDEELFELITRLARKVEVG